MVVAWVCTAKADDVITGNAMTETRSTYATHCGHDERFVISSDEGTCWCALCELEAANLRVAELEAQVLAMKNCYNCGNFDCAFRRIHYIECGDRTLWKSKEVEG